MRVKVYDSPGPHQGPNAQSSPSEKAAIVRRANSSESARNKFGMEIIHTIEVDAYKIHIARPTSPYSPGSFVVWAERPDLAVVLEDARESLSNIDWAEAVTQVVTDLPQSVQWAYWNTLLHCLVITNQFAEKRISEKKALSYKVFVADNMLDSVSTTERETNRSLVVPHSHVVIIENEDTLPIVDLTDLFTEVQRVKDHELFERLLLNLMQSLTKWLNAHHLSFTSISQSNQPQGLTVTLPFENGKLDTTTEVILELVQWLQRYQARFTQLAMGLVQDEELLSFIHSTTFKKVGFLLYAELCQVDSNPQITIVISPTFIGHKGILEQAGYLPNRVIGEPTNEFDDLYKQLKNIQLN